MIELRRKAMKKFIQLALALTALVATGMPASAQSYPNQRVTIVVPFGAGSVTDILARIVADEMGKKWNQQVIVENRPGLAGTTAVGKAAPDGYTLMLTSNGHTVAGLVSKTLTVDPVKDFSGITRIASAPLYLITYPGLGAKTLKDVLAKAKEQPGKLNFSSPGLASTTFIAGALFRKTAGVNIVHVPFKSAPDAVTAVIRNDVQMACLPAISVTPQVATGKVKILAVSTARRSPYLPDVPTLKESGIDVEADAWNGLIAPAGTAQATINTINRDVVEIIRSAAVRDRLAPQLMEPIGSTPEEFRARIDGEIARWKPVIETADIKVN
jgi:tripartite-type tricarboxylate transporter receptor subunit TctC